VQPNESPSLISAEVSGYGGGEGEETVAGGYFITFEGQEFEWSKSTITVAELRSLAGLPADHP
jgi:hypothetical protein